MGNSKFVSSDPKSGMESIELDKLSAEIKQWIERIDELNGDRLETKAEMALKNKLISPEQEKELFDLVNDSSSLYDRYSQGERTEDLLVGLENYCHILEQKRNEIFPDAPKDAKLSLAKKGGEGINNKEKNMPEQREPLIITPAEQREPLKITPAEKSEPVVSDKKETPEEVHPYGERVYTKEEEKEIYGLVGESSKAEEKKESKSEIKEELEKQADEKRAETENKETGKEIIERKEAAVPEKKEQLSMEKLKKEVEKARTEYIKSEAEAKKADTVLSRLGKIRESLFGAKKEETDDKKKSGAKKDKEEMKKFSEDKRIAYEEAKKVFAKGLYDEKMKVFDEWLKVRESGKDGGLMKPEEHEKDLAELKFEVVKAAILDEKEALNKEKFAALPEKERGMCMKAMARYGQLPQWSKVLISASVATGATLAFSSGVGFAMVGGVFAWKALRIGVGTTAGLLAGKGYNWAFDKAFDVKNIKTKNEQIVIDEIKANISLDKLDKKEEGAEENKEKKFDDWFSGLAASTNQKMDQLAAKEKRLLLGKAIGQGVVIAGVAGVTSLGMEKIGANFGLNPIAKPSVPTEGGPKANAAGAVGAVEGAPKPSVTAGVEKLAIGTRGPEGAIIDNFKANPKLAESFGYNPKSGVSLDTWAGTKAHQLWLASVETDLKNPKIVAELAKHGYQANPEDYAKAMHKIGKGFVELDPQGHIHLGDDTSFLKKVVPSEAPEVAATNETPSIVTGEELRPNTPEVLEAKEVVTPKIVPETAPIAPEVLEKFKTDGVKNILQDSGGMKPAEYEAIKKMTYRDYLSKVSPNEDQAWQAWRDGKVDMPHDESGLGLHTAAEYNRQIGLSKIIGQFKDASEITDKTTVEEVVNKLAERSEAAKTGVVLPEIAPVKSGANLSELKASTKVNLPEPTPGGKINLPEPVKTSGQEIISGSGETDKILHGAEEAQNTATVLNKAGKSAMEAAAVAPEKQAIIKGFVDSKSAVNLVADVKAGKLSVDDVANYYAQNIKNTNAPAATLSPENMAKLKETLSTAANGSGIKKTKALQAVGSMLERLKQGK